MDTTKYVTDTSRTVVAAMEAAGENRLTLATKTRIPRSTLVRRLDGIGSLTVDELYRIANVLHLPVVSLLADEDVAA